MCLKKEQLEKLDSIIDKMIEEDVKQDELDKEIYGEKEESIGPKMAKLLKKFLNHLKLDCI